jgi:hypothetical protein
MTAPSELEHFSLVKAVIRAARDHGGTLRSLGTTEIISTEGELDHLEFDTRVNALRVWCRSVERLLVERRFPELRIHAGFERMSRIVPVQKRYHALGAIADAVTVYGIPDYDPEASSLRTIPLAKGPLLNEWFFVARARGFSAVIVAEDLDGFGGAVPLMNRRFRGLVTHQPAVVAEAMKQLDAVAAKL